MKEKLISIAVTVITTLIIAGLTAYFTFFKSLYEHEVQLDNLSRKIDGFISSYNVSVVATVGSENQVENEFSDPSNIIFRETFTNSMSGWVKSAKSFQNSIQNGSYYVNALEKEWVYSTLAVKQLASTEALENYSIELTCNWIGAEHTNLPFGLLLFKDFKNLIRFEITKSGEAKAELRNNGVESPVIGIQKVLDDSSGEIVIKIEKINSDYKYFVNDVFVGAFKAVGFEYENIGVFQKGPQEIVYNELTAKTLTDN